MVLELWYQRMVSSCWSRRSSFKSTNFSNEDKSALFKYINDTGREEERKYAGPKDCDGYFLMVETPCRRPSSVRPSFQPAMRPAENKCSFPLCERRPGVTLLYSRSPRAAAHQPLIKERSGPEEAHCDTGYN
ncbi:hypothetical protein EYF80_016009 [Liparis tanakae]|uniref:Uncharacterized protein n=1 Tax=Liparis tanakae TaxID=230148 RepID=A0A4Z2I7P4_9TELE|nr:hypothetical protein EYF80_016009 [Liparis tanakae]